MIAKSLFRMTFSNMTIFSTDLRTRLMILTEHALFTFWGWRVIVDVPLELHLDSWMFTTIDCWRKPVFPFAEFHYYYKVKMATHLEDLLVMGYQFLTSKDDKKVQSESDRNRNHHNASSNPAGDKYMVIHHIVTALLCITSYLTTYCKIGSLVMFLHDASDLPLDFLRMASALNWKAGQILFYPCTLLAWLYYRLWFLPTTVMQSINTESTSFLRVNCPCGAGECHWSKYPLEAMVERGPFLILLGALLYLHFVWFALLLKKGYREFVPSKDNNKKD